MLEELSWTKRFALAEAEGLARVYVRTILVPGKKSKRVRGPPKVM